MFWVDGRTGCVIIERKTRRELGQRTGCVIKNRRGQVKFFGKKIIINRSRVPVTTNHQSIYHQSWNCFGIDAIRFILLTALWMDTTNHQSIYHQSWYCFGIIYIRKSDIFKSLECTHCIWILIWVKVVIPLNAVWFLCWNLVKGRVYLCL